MNDDRKSFDRQTPAVVLGLFDTGLVALRALGRRGIPVLGFDSSPRQPGFWSRYGGARPCPDPLRQPGELLRFLLDEAARLARPAVLFPANDAYVLFLARHRDRLAGSFLFTIPPGDLLEVILDKRRQYALADDVGMPHARTFTPESREDVNRIADAIEYPALVKPYFTHLWQAQFGIVKGLRADNPRQLREHYERVFANGLGALVQEIIPGPNPNHFLVDVYISADGRPLATFVARKRRQYPTEFGVGTMLESVDCPELARLAVGFCRDIGYRGLGEIEVKRDERDGQFKLIELNPRLWQQAAHAARCGIDFALLQYLDLTGQQTASSSRSRVGVKWLDLVNDLLAGHEYWRRGELTLWNWLRSYRGTEAFSRFAFDDPIPFFATRGAAALRRLVRTGDAGGKATTGA
jgi:predicted ATP-grasp superfamily ATP-dependent carboligase